MIIGKWTIRRTSDIEAEQVAHDKAKRISAIVTEALLHDNRRYKAILRRWGLSEGVIGYRAGKGASKRSKPPKGAVASV